jgi:dihydrofolate reductase
MKVIINFAPTVNGMLNKGANDDYSWISQESWDDYKRVSQECGCVVMGRGTYELMSPKDFYEGVLYVVMTHDTSLKSDNSHVMFSLQSSKEVLKELEKKGFNKVCLGGGSKLACSFLKEALVDEVYLNIEPRIFGKGLPMVFPDNFTVNLELIEVKTFDKDTVRVRYRVKREE